jgi:hypothetical protein
MLVVFRAILGAGIVKLTVLLDGTPLTLAFTVYVPGGNKGTTYRLEKPPVLLVVAPPIPTDVALMCCIAKPVTLTEFI